MGQGTARKYYTPPRFIPQAIFTFSQPENLKKTFLHKMRYPFKNPLSQSRVRASVSRQAIDVTESPPQVGMK